MTSVLSIGLVIFAVFLVFVATSNQAKSRPRDDRHLEPPPKPRRSRRIARSSNAARTANGENPNPPNPILASASLSTVTARDLLGPTWPVFR